MLLNELNNLKNTYNLNLERSYLMQGKIWLIGVPLWIAQVIPDELRGDGLVVPQPVMLFYTQEALELPQSDRRTVLAIQRVLVEDIVDILHRVLYDNICC